MSNMSNMIYVALYNKRLNKQNSEFRVNDTSLIGHKPLYASALQSLLLIPFGKFIISLNCMFHTFNLNMMKH